MLVLTYFRYFNKILILLALSVFAISCCPPEGVDRSHHDNSYNVTIDIFDSSIQQPINSLDQESRLTLVLSDSSKKDSQGFIQNQAFHNRYTFQFEPSVQDENVNSIEVKLIDFQRQVVNYKTISKKSFQLEPLLLSANIWDGFFCSLNPIDLILPRAHALSCKNKSGSKVTYNAGQLFSLGLFPETP